LVSVADTGPGISPKDVERIFEPFCQGTSGPWRDKGGSGLGLSISKQFVKSHGGRIWLETELGKGTTFYFTLSISPPIDHLARPGHWIKEDWPWFERSSRVELPSSTFRSRFIVCDEIGDLYSAFTRYSDEIEFVETRSLAEIKKQLAHAPAHAILLNSVSPEDLWTLVDQVRRMVPDTPVIGCCVPPQLKRAWEAGATSYLTKPVTRADVKAAIEGLDQPIKRVLVVDDDPEMVQLLMRMLKAYDVTLEVLTADNGVAALHQLVHDAPDLVLLDVVLPDLDGWQVLEQKNRDDRLKHIPVIIISAQDLLLEPTATRALMATMGEGLSLGKSLRCSLELSEILLKPS
jgi:CheY-like chemotaxis protein